MGEAVGDDAALAFLLQRVVADRAGGGQALFQIARFHAAAVLCGPDAGVAIGLQLEADRGGIALPLRTAALDLLHLVRRAEQVLDVMAEFVGDHVILREVTLGAEAIGQFVEEAGVEVDALVGRAVKRTHRRLRGAAARPSVLVEEGQARGAEALAALREDLFPSVFRRAERVAGGALVGVG